MTVKEIATAESTDWYFHAKISLILSEIRCLFVPGTVKCSGMKNNTSAGDSVVFESCELTGKLLEYLTIVVTTFPLWSGNMPAIAGIHWGHIVWGHNISLVAAVKLDSSDLPEFFNDSMYVTGGDFR